MADTVDEHFNKKCEIKYNDELGRYISAATNIKAGETIMIERPVLILPNLGERRCSNCYKLTSNFCSACKIFSLCADCRTHNEYDCEWLCALKEVNIEELQKWPDIYGVLKCLLLRANPTTTHFYDRFMELEAHLAERRNTDIWRTYTTKVYEPMQRAGLVEQLNKIKQSDLPEIDEELVQRIYAIVDVNVFEIRSPEEGQTMRGCYLRGALFTHNCVANTVMAIDSQYRMKMYANCSVEMGSTFYNCYTNILLGTDERLNLLKMGKYFRCLCARCEDPTELGSHMSSFICAHCAANNREDAYIVKQRDGIWQCQLNPAHTLKTDFVEGILERAKEEIFHSRADIYRYEILLSKLSRILHRNHYLLLDMKQNIAAMLRVILQNITQRPGRKVYERKIGLCEEILTVLRIIQPGISRLKAIAMYELADTTAELQRKLFSEMEIDDIQLLAQLQRTEQMLRESLLMLLHEPIETPEGQLARNMIRELKDLQNDMAMLKEKGKLVLTETK